MEDRDKVLELLKSLPKDERDALLKAAKKAERDEKGFEDFLRVNLEEAGNALIAQAASIRTARAKLDKAVKAGKRDEILKAAKTVKTLLSDSYLLGGSRANGPYELRYAVCPEEGGKDYFETFFGFAPVFPEGAKGAEKSEKILNAAIDRVVRNAPAKRANRTRKTTAAKATKR